MNAILPSGRIAWFRVLPPIAAAGEANHFLQHADRAVERRADAIRSVASGLGRGSLALDQARLARGKRLRRRLVRSRAALERRMSVEFGRQRAELARLFRWERRMARRIDRRALWDAIVVASSAPLLAAYGQRGSALAVNNVTLTLGLALWLVGDDLLRLLSDRSSARREYLHDTDIWSYLAPLANLLSGWWLMHERQHARFATGVTERFDLAKPVVVRHPVMGRVSRYVARVPLPLQTVDHLHDRGRPGPAAVFAQVRTLAWSPKAGAAKSRFTDVQAQLDEEELVITVSAAAFDPVTRRSAAGATPLSQLSVGWVLDTGAIGGGDDG